MNLHPIDLGLVGLYLAVVLVIGVRFARRQNNPEEYFLASRRLGWPVVGLSLFASNVSSTTLVGLAGAAYDSGISVANYEWMVAVVMVVFAAFFVPRYLESRLYTIPEYLEQRFSPVCRYYFSALTIAGNILIDTAATLYAGALVIQLFFPSVPLWLSSTTLALIAGLYTAAGGLSAVVYTDTFQSVVLIVGTSVLALFALEAAGSWEAVVEATPPSKLRLFQPSDDPTMPWLGALTGIPIINLYFWTTNQFVVQRVLAARDVDHARKGALLNGLLKLSVLFTMIFPGIIARHLYPDLARPDLAFPTLVTEILPTGLRGLVLATLVAAIMSSIDSTLNSASTLVTMDFVKKLRPYTSDAALTRIGRVVTVMFMVISVVWVPVVARSANIFAYLQTALSFAFPPVVALFVLGIFWPRANARGALCGLVFGQAISVATFVSRTFLRWPQIHETILGGIFFALTCVVIAAVSLATEPPPARALATPARSTEASRAIPEEKPSLAAPRPCFFQFRYSQFRYSQFRVQAGALLALSAWLVWTYA